MTTETLTWATRGTTALQADLYRAAIVGAPLLIAVHGGAWQRGERGQLAHWGRYLAANGISTLAIDYRKASQDPVWPDNLEDVRDAWLYARDHAVALGTTPDRIGFLGASAGAHLSALAALATPAKARVLVLAYGVYDLFAHCRAQVEDEAPGDNPAIGMIGGTPDEMPEAFSAASPHLQIDAARAAGMKTLLTWGTGDRIVLPSQSETFGAALASAGAGVTLAPIERAGHFWFSRDAIDDPTGFTNMLAPRVVRFLREAFDA